MESKPNLFPHCFLPEPMIKKVVSFFGHVRIYQPWFINPPEFYKGFGLEIINPPYNLKPKEDIRAILSGYHAWAEQNYDKSYKEIIKFRDNVSSDDNTIWEIKQLLTGGAQPGAGINREEHLTLKWHLLLHLACEIERQNFGVMDMMTALKKKGFVLAGALQEPDEVKNVLTDMDDITSTDVPDNLNIGGVIEAWFGLFRGYLNNNDILVTCSNHVMDYISSQWDDGISKEESSSPHSITFRLPDPSSEGYKHGDIKKIKELILKFGKDPDHSINDLHQLTNEIEDTFPRESSQGILKFQLRYFPSMGSESSFETNSLLSHIAGKTIILMTSL